MSYNKETDMYEGYIYKIYNDVNDKVYIGQTSRTIKERWRQHKNDTKKYKYSLYNSINKHGIAKFHIEEIDMVYATNKRELHVLLDNKEIYWIEFYDSYNNGYNETIGGQNNAPNKFTERPVAEYNIDCILENIYPSLSASSEATGFNRSDINSCCLKKKVNRVQNKIFRYLDNPLTQEEIEWYRLKYPKIYQYDYYGNLLNTFEFIKDAVNYLASKGINVDNGNIVKCCIGENLSSGGYVWRKYPDSFGTYRTPEILKRIEKRDINYGNLLEVFDTFDEIHNKYKYDISTINNCCLNRTASSYGFHWCYEGNYNPSNLSRIKFKSIVQYSPDGKYISTYNSAYDAVDCLNLTGLSASAQILSVCNGKRNIAFGFVWRYLNDDFTKYKVKIPYVKHNINKYISGKFVETFSSALDAAQSVGCTNYGYIRECCKHKRLSYRDAEWYYANDPNQPDKTKIIA